MKTKMVVKLCMHDAKSRRKALKISVGISGVESATLTGPEKDHVEVVGECVDAVALMRKLRKNVARTELLSYNEVEKVEAPAAKAVDPTPQPPVVVCSHPPPWIHVCEVMAPPSYVYDSSCNIL